MIGIINTIVTKVLNSQSREFEFDPNESADRFSVMGDSRVSVNTQDPEIPETPHARPSLIRSLVVNDKMDNGIIQSLFLTPN
jgi:hypothetical protein